MQVRHLALASIAAALIAACSGTGASPSAPPATASPTPAVASPTPAASASTAETTIEITLTDTLKIEPAPLRVPAGVPITFVITNTGTAEHEFYLGDEASQAEHEQEMQSMGGMAHDDPNGVAVAPGETKELTFTFDEPGETLAGCHVAGHYAGGMKAPITVTG